MGKVILYHLDGALPNLALMRIARCHADNGDDVELRQGPNVDHHLWDKGNETVYGSLIFEKTRPIAQRLLKSWPDAKIGGTGWDLSTTLESIGIYSQLPDYSIYPKYEFSIGFSQRGCRLKCPFCVVPRKEGAVTEEHRIDQIWRGDPWPRKIVLLDNDFFGQPKWEKRIIQMVEGKFQVNFNQGINARFLSAETAEAIAKVKFMDRNFKRRCIYTAWDNRKDEKRLFAGLTHLTDTGIRPRDIMVYILLGYWPWSDLADWEYRRRQLREFGAVPYPMPFERTKESVGFQRWIVGAYDKRVPWEDWVRADYRPNKLKLVPSPAGN